MVYTVIPVLRTSLLFAVVALRRTGAAYVSLGLIILIFYSGADKLASGSEARYKRYV